MQSSEKPLIREASVIRKNRAIWTVCILLVLSACAPVNTALPSVTSAPESTDTPELIRSPSFLTPTATTPSVAPTALGEPTATSAQKTCPTLHTDSSRNVLQRGSLLFQIAGETSELWAFSAGDEAPRQIPAIRGSSFTLDPSGHVVAYREFQNGKHMLSVYDLSTKSKSSWPWAQEWLSTAGWTKDGRVKLLTSWIREDDIGETLTYALLSPPDGTVTPLIREELGLPGYSLEENNPRAGYVSLNGNRDLAFYTAWGVSGKDLVLRDISSGDDLWRYEAENAGTTFSPPAAWTPSGSKVAFVLAKEPGINSQILSLSSDAQILVELTDHPLADYKDYIIDSLQWSPKESYLYFALFEGPSGGPGFMLNSATLEIREVCDPLTTLASAEWVADEELLAYVVQKQDGAKELRLLDVGAWQVDVIGEFVAGAQVEVLGWTPVESP